MYYLEILMGQYTRSGTIKIWDICPIFRGVGIGITIMNMFVNVYFIIIMTWSMHFMFARFVYFSVCLHFLFTNIFIFVYIFVVVSFAPLFNEDGLLPWTKCDEWWNTENCRTPLDLINASKNLNISNNGTVSSTEEYWK